MVTKEEIKAKYAKIHADLTQQYYVDKTIDKETFEAEHRKCWEDMDAELLAYGFLKKVWRYSFGKTISTTAGDFAVEVTILSSTQLSSDQIEECKSELGTVDWLLTATEELLVEV